MPRHPPNALTSRLRTHTTNDKTELLQPAAMLRILSQLSKILLKRAILPADLPCGKPNQKNDASRIDF
jgi:hypothetical protein